MYSVGAGIEYTVEYNFNFIVPLICFFFSIGFLEVIPRKIASYNLIFHPEIY